jgi:Uma2 family endonuclease
MDAPVLIPKATRHVFTVDDVLRMQEQGYFADPKRIALHEGDIVEMAHDGDEHIGAAMGLAERIILALASKGYFVGVQTTLRLSRTNAPSPDLYTLRGGRPKGDVAAERILLVIEVAVTSLKEDLTETAARYARAGVSEFWVVDAVKGETHVHRDPVGGEYPAPRVVPATETLRPAQIPELALRIADLAL